MGRERYPFDPTRQPVNLFSEQVSASAADAYFYFAEGAFKAAKDNPYEGSVERLFRNLAPDHLKALNNSQGILEALSRQDMVQQGQTLKATSGNIIDLNWSIREFLTEFKNTGVRKGQGGYFC